MPSTPTPSATIHILMLAQSERLGLPTHFRCDLTTDLEYLDGRWGPPADSFLWVLYDCGTHLVPLSPYSAGNRPTVFVDAIAKSFGPDLHWYHWTGHTLHSVTESQARSIAQDVRPARSLNG